ncbi:MAG TPA: nucleotidyltransferase domain-containing protein [Ktedonobacteraceae bacterium]
MSKFTGASMKGVQEQQAVSLADEFLHELVQELDHEDIVGITLGGSYAQGRATLYSDVDLACFWREGLRPPPKRFLYRQDKLISIKMTSVTEIHELLKRPQSAMLFASGKRRLLLDKGGWVHPIMSARYFLRFSTISSLAEKPADTTIIESKRAIVLRALRLIRFQKMSIV